MTNAVDRNGNRQLLLASRFEKILILPASESQTLAYAKKKIKTLNIDEG